MDDKEKTSTGRPNIKQSEKHIVCKLTGTEKRRRHKEPTLPIGSPTGTYGQDPVGGTEKPGTKNRLTSTLVSVWPTISSLPMVFKCFTAINFFFFSSNYKNSSEQLIKNCILYH